jgi:predicted transcriptional regulator
MAKVKATFTLDQTTIKRLQLAAERLRKPKSQIVREAIHEYTERIGRLSEEERVRMLRALDEFEAMVPARPRSEVEAELKAIREARRSGGRRTMVE